MISRPTRIYSAHDCVTVTFKWSINDFNKLIWQKIGHSTKHYTKFGQYFFYDKNCVAIIWNQFFFCHVGNLVKASWLSHLWCIFKFSFNDTTHHSIHYVLSMFIFRVIILLIASATENSINSTFQFVPHAIYKMPKWHLYSNYVLPSKRVCIILLILACAKCLRLMLLVLNLRVSFRKFYGFKESIRVRNLTHSIFKLFEWFPDATSEFSICIRHIIPLICTSSTTVDRSRFSVFWKILCSFF